MGPRLCWPMHFSTPSPLPPRRSWPPRLRTSKRRRHDSFKLRSWCWVKGSCHGAMLYESDASVSARKSFCRCHSASMLQVSAGAFYKWKVCVVPTSFHPLVSTVFSSLCGSLSTPPPRHRRNGCEEMVRQLKQRCQSLEAQLSKRCAWFGRVSYYWFTRRHL